MKGWCVCVTYCMLYWDLCAYVSRVDLQACVCCVRDV